MLDQIDELENERDQLNQEADEERNLKKKFEELYSEEREKNLALRKHLDEISKEEKKPIPRNQSARPRSASKYGRKNDSHNATKNDEEKYLQNENNIGTQDDFGSNASAEKEILLNRINFTDIEAIAIELRETFKTRKIPFHEIRKILPLSMVSLTDLKDLLSNEFNIEETDALMTARYIFEEEDEENETKIIFDEDKQLSADAIADRLQAFVRLDNTVDPYKLEEEETDGDIDEEIPQESIEATKNQSLKEAKKQLEQEEDIDENYSDIDDDFEPDKPTDAQVKRPDSPKIEEESTDNKPYEQSPKDDEPEESEIDEDKGLEIAET